jgi:hypothetical protein
MSSVEEAERVVRELSREELSAFRQWFIEFDADAWDREIEEDVAAGRLDALGDAALKNFREGRARPL